MGNIVFGLVNLDGPVKGVEILEGVGWVLWEEVYDIDDDSFVLIGDDETMQDMDRQ